MIRTLPMKPVVVCLLLGLVLFQVGCKKREAPADPGAGATKQKGVSIDGAPDAAQPGQPADAAAPAPPPPEAPAPEAPQPAAGADTLQGESELSDWSYTLQDFVYRTKRYPRDIAELAISVHKAVPRAPAGYKIGFDKENQRVVLQKGN
jgi:hypothetical protein